MGAQCTKKCYDRATAKEGGYIFSQISGVVESIGLCEVPIPRVMRAKR